MLKKNASISIFLLLFFECLMILFFLCNAHTDSPDGVNITSITPESYVNTAPADVTIHGSGFTPDTEIYLCSEELTGWQGASGSGLNIPRTGQMTSYYPGDDGDLRIGIEWPKPRFTDNEDGTVTDELTGLMWFKNASVTGTYSWDGALQYCSNASLGGRTDWRLPNTLEMFSLFCAQNFDPPLPSDHMFIDFKTGSADGTPRRYWVSNSYYRNGSWSGYKCFLNVTDFTWSDDPRGGWAGREFYFIPVRGEPGNGIYDVPRTGKVYSYTPGDDGNLQKGLAWPSPRFIDNDDGTITDTMTNLMWAKDAYQAGTEKTWEDALAYCNNLEYADYTDWHLPNVFQLLSIIDFEYYKPDKTALPPGHPFIHTDHNNYWTSTSSDENMAYVFIKFIQIDTEYGRIPMLRIYDKSEAKNVWPVRVADGLSTCLNIINGTSANETDGIIKLTSAFTDTYTLQATIPDSIAPGMYHIIARNPDGEAGILHSGFESLCLDCDNDGYSEAGGDCKDHDATVYPGAPELCDGKDNDCNLLIPENELDADMDGYMTCEGDCDDHDAGVHPGEVEMLCNGKDDDCNPSTTDCPMTITSITPNSSTDDLPVEATIHGSGFTLQSQVHILIEGTNIIGNYDTPGDAHGVTISGNYAYVADGFSGFHIIDISDPKNPLYVGGYDTPDEAWEIALKGDYALVADGKSGLLVFDITDPSDPVHVGGYQILGHPSWLDPSCDPVHMGWTKGITIRGDYAYISDGSNGIHILDITNPEEPIPVGSCDTPNAYAQALKGNYTYVINYSYGLQVIDITDLSDPQIVFNKGLSNGALDIFINNYYAYLTSRKGFSLQVIDIANPTNPLLIGGCYIRDDPRALLTHGEYAFVVGEQKGLHIVEISNPADPLPLKTYDTPGRAQDIAISGQYIYIADGESGLQIVEGLPRSLSVSYIDPFTLKVAIPANLTKGLYDIMVLNPDGTYRVLHEGFANSCTDCDNDGYTTEDGDCNDLDEWVYTGAPELCDGRDNDCDQVIPECERDADHDGYMVCEGDCDDQDVGIHPGAIEIDDGKDNDCDGLTDEDMKWHIWPPIYPPIPWIFPPWIYPEIKAFPKEWEFYPIISWKPYESQEPFYHFPWFIQPSQSWTNSYMSGFKDYLHLLEMPFYFYY